VGIEEEGMSGMAQKMEMAKRARPKVR